MNFSLADYKNVILLTIKVAGDLPTHMSERFATAAETGRHSSTEEHHFRDDREGTALLATVLLGVTLSLLTTPVVAGALVVVPLMVLVTAVQDC